MGQYKTADQLSLVVYIQGGRSEFRARQAYILRPYLKRHKHRTCRPGKVGLAASVLTICFFDLTMLLFLTVLTRSHSCNPQHILSKKTAI